MSGLRVWGKHEGAKSAVLGLQTEITLLLKFKTISSIQSLHRVKDLDSSQENTHHLVFSDGQPSCFSPSFLSVWHCTQVQRAWLLQYPCELYQVLGWSTDPLPSSEVRRNFYYWLQSGQDLTPGRWHVSITFKSPFSSSDTSCMCFNWVVLCVTSLPNERAFEVRRGAFPCLSIAVTLGWEAHVGGGCHPIPNSTCRNPSETSAGVLSNVSVFSLKLPTHWGWLEEEVMHQVWNLARWRVLLMGSSASQGRGVLTVSCPIHTVQSWGTESSFPTEGMSQ